MTTETEKAPMAAPDKPLHLWTPAEVKAVYPKKPPKPIAKYDLHELVAQKNFGPAVIGGELYLAAQKASIESKAERFGPAIVSKGVEPVAFVTEGK